MWCAPSCGCAGCKGIPEPYPLLNYLCTADRTCKCRCIQCATRTEVRGAPDDGLIEA